MLIGSFSAKAVGLLIVRCLQCGVRETVGNQCAEPNRRILGKRMLRIGDIADSSRQAKPREGSCRGGDELETELSLYLL